MTETFPRGSGSGLPRSLAASRSRQIGALAYALALDIPAAVNAPISGRVSIDLTLTSPAWPPLDFAPAAGDADSSRRVLELAVDGAPTAWRLENGRIHLMGEAPASGRHRIDIRFIAGDAGLTRRDDLVYSLFVPARAHTVFPCFDQPDRKARLSLALELPGGWEALANAPEVSRRTVADREQLAFAATEPLSTYLFAFVAGRLRRETGDVRGREFVILHPPAAEAALDAQGPAIRELHAAALDALEAYTGEAHPFAQTGCVLIPDFEFAGMEHPGAIFYRQNQLLLPADAGLAEKMRRATLIAHETAHLWFGDLVTMPWFDDVWLKEVCANFMADRIVASLFPDVDHASAFLLRHFPAASAIDRTAGTHPIRQALDNLGEAAQLYDPLIYHKAPIAFVELEREIGADAMRAGLSRYLADFRFACADWPALRDRLQQESRCDIADFSRLWFETAGWPAVVDGFDRNVPPRYAAVRLDDHDRLAAIDALTTAPEARMRAAAWLALFEDGLDGGIGAAPLLTAGLGALEGEANALLIARLLEDLAEIFWRWLPPSRRALAAGPLERTLCLRAGAGTGAFTGTGTGPGTGAGAGAGPERAWLRPLMRFAHSEAMIATLDARWRSATAAGSEIAMDQRHALTLELALRRPERAEALIAGELARTRNAEARARLEFLAPALSPEPETRERCFDGLLAGRDREQWALVALSLLCHPLRADEALAYLDRGIARARELHARAELFLPRQWLGALFSGQATPAAATQIRHQIESAGLAPRFRELLLQTADPVFRAARIRIDD